MPGIYTILTYSFYVYLLEIVEDICGYTTTYCIFVFCVVFCLPVVSDYLVDFVCLLWDEFWSQ